jgi:hypothetical protein
MSSSLWFNSASGHPGVAGSPRPRGGDTSFGTIPDDWTGETRRDSRFEDAEDHTDNSFNLQPELLTVTHESSSTSAHHLQPHHMTQAHYASPSQRDWLGNTGNRAPAPVALDLSPKSERLRGEGDGRNGSYGVLSGGVHPTARVRHLISTLM